MPLYSRVLVVLAILAVLVAFIFGPATDARAKEPISTRSAEKLARTACASCHAFPNPDVLPRAAWRVSVEKMALIALGKGIPQWVGARPRG